VAWASFGDDFHDDPQAYRAGATALGVWAVCRSWCADKLTDGRIPKALFEAKALGLRADPAAVAADLIRAELYRDDGDAYVDVRYLEENPSRERVIAKKQAAGKRYDAWRSSKKGKQEYDSNALGAALPTRLPRDVRSADNGRQTRLPPLPSPLVSSHSSETQNAGGRPREGVSGSDQARAEAHGDDAVSSAQAGPKNVSTAQAATSVTAEDHEGQEWASEAEQTKEAQRLAAYARYAAPYSAGVASETGGEHVVVERHELERFGAITTRHAVVGGKALRGDALAAWLRDRGAAYVRATRHAAQFQRGYAPSKFLEWLSAGSPPAPAGPNGTGRPKRPGHTYNAL
jgi:hypothetical protein